MKQEKFIGLLQIQVLKGRSEKIQKAESQIFESFRFFVGWTIFL